MKIHVSLALKQMIILHRRTYHRMAATSETRSRPSYCKELPFSRTLEDHGETITCRLVAGRVSVKLAHGE